MGGLIWAAGRRAESAIREHTLDELVGSGAGAAAGFLVGDYSLAHGVVGAVAGLGVAVAFYAGVAVIQTVVAARRRKAFIAHMRRHVPEHPRAKVFYANLDQLRGAETLAADFTLAGWGSQLVGVQLEQLDGRPHDGLVVKGPNRGLVTEVAQALRSRGLVDVVEVVAPFDDSPTPTNDPSSSTIFVTVGRGNEDLGGP